MQPLRPLSRSALPVDTVELARFLVGKFIVHDSPDGRSSGRIVETEAYLAGDDAAAHSFRGPTPRTMSMYLGRGHAYVYFIYGAWFCMNVTGGLEGAGTAVLLRALEPVDGITLMHGRRPGAHPSRLAVGPGNLATAMGIDRSFDGCDLCKPGPLWLAKSGARSPRVDIGISRRIGITKDAHRLLRFYDRGSSCVSGPRSLRQ
jgi:DNA-3-methyladenine glycosylase